MLMSTFYYSTNVYEFSSTIYFSSAFYWVFHDVSTFHYS